MPIWILFELVLLINVREFKMKIKKNNPNTNALLAFLAAILAIIAAPTVSAEESLINALTSGKASFSARLRYENVEQENKPEDANAYTARLTAAYKTATYYGFGAFA